MRWSKLLEIKRSRRILLVCLALYLVSQVFFLINIQYPKGHNFDEFHYVPSAKQFLQGIQNQNWEHPPLGKLIMAAGIGIFGDNPLGWRFMSTVFGSLTLVGMYFWALALFGSELTALWVALLTVFNQLLYVQARIGMLDTFMFTFMVWALAAFTATWQPDFTPKNDPKHARPWLDAAGVLFGLSIACKWFAIIPWLSCLLLVAVIRLIQSWKTRFEEPSSQDWYRPDLWAGLSTWDLFRSWVVLPLLVYFATFIPYFIIQKPHVGFWDLFVMQKTMYEGQLRVVSQHPYMSQWTDWPLLKRPIWYAFDKEGSAQEWVRGVLLLGNPLIMWAGLLGLVACLMGWIEEKRRDGFLVIAFYSAFYLSWALIPRKISFYYYYYPAGMLLSLALGYVFHRLGETHWSPSLKWVPQLQWLFLGLAAAVFIYFFPILAALKVPSSDFYRWMWFRTWI